jgi:hypothetical protein
MLYTVCNVGIRKYIFIYHIPHVGFQYLVIRKNQNLWKFLQMLNTLPDISCYSLPNSFKPLKVNVATVPTNLQVFSFAMLLDTHTHTHTHIYIYIHDGRGPAWNNKVKWSRYRPGVAQRVGRGIALLFHDRSTPRPHFTLGKEPVPILQEAEWAPGSVWTGRKSRPHRDSIPDRPARSSVAIPTELPGPLHEIIPRQVPQKSVIC